MVGESLRAFALLPLALAAACGVAGSGDGGPVRQVEGDLRIVPSEELIEAPDTRVGFASPAENERFAEGESVEVRFRLSGFLLGAPTPGGDGRGILRDPGGQHLHFLLNNEPYGPVYGLDDPVVLDDLPAGTHVLRVFAAADWHESVKAPGAFATRIIHVDPDGSGPLEGGNASPARGPRDLESPLLTFSRPRGSYAGADADSVLVDFHLSGVRLDPEGYRVHLTVRGVGEATIVRWTPLLLLDLPDGEHVIRLELQDSNGVAVPGGFNSVERTFRVTRAGR